LRVGILSILAAPACAFALSVFAAAGPAAAATSSRPVVAAAKIATGGSGGDWPSYNKELRSARFSPLSGIDTGNVTQLHELCEYDTAVQTGFESGLIEAGGLLYGTTDTDTFALDASSCRLIWRAHEVFETSAPLKVNRGAVIFDGRLFRGMLDGRVVAYDALRGKRLWSARILDASVPQAVTAAPIAWENLVFVGNANGDFKGTRGLITALSARDGRIVWQQSLVPAQPGEPLATGWGSAKNINGGTSWTSYSLDTESGLLYVPVGNPAPDFDNALRPGTNRYTNSVLVLEARSGRIVGDIPVVPGDFRDYDVAAAPALFTSKAGNRLLAVAAKDGVLRVFDRVTMEKQFEVPVTEIKNRNVPLGLNDSVHYCPGAAGGVEWNGPAYDPSLNRIFTGAVQWCVTLTLAPVPETLATQKGQAWTGQASSAPGNPAYPFGVFDPVSTWAGWLYSVDADSGQVIWNYKASFPFLAGVTVTGGGVLFAGDLGGTLYAFTADTGRLLWSRPTGGALAGGIITYEDHGAQRVAVASGIKSDVWPIPPTNAKVVVFGLDSTQR
jgi:alcohol dehydrogenase (cytochrome c)